MATYRFYTNRAQRIAAFGKIVDNKLQIVEFRCSHKDNFSKEIAMILFGLYQQLVREGKNPLKEGISLQFKGKLHHAPKEIIFHPLLTAELDLQEGVHLKKQFLEFMEANYYRMVTYPVQYERTRLVRSRNRELIQYLKAGISDREEHPKMSRY